MGESPMSPVFIKFYDPTYFLAHTDNILDHMLADTPERLSSDDDVLPSPPKPRRAATARENGSGAHARTSHAEAPTRWDCLRCRPPHV